MTEKQEVEQLKVKKCLSKNFLSILSIFSLKFFSSEKPISRTANTDNGEEGNEGVKKLIS